MSKIGQNDVDNPFSAAGRAHGKSPEELRNQGLTGQGHPAASPGQSRNGQASGVSRPGGVRNQNIAQLAQSIGSMELANQDDLYAFCEAIRQVLNYFAVSIKLAEGQLKAGARQQAKQAKDGWMTPVQIGKLQLALRRVGKDLNQSADACVEGAAGAVKAWRRFETLLDELENGDSGSKFRRPGGRSGGFSVV